MSSDANVPAAPHDGSDLVELREEIDRLQAIPHEELVSPVRTSTEEEELVPEPTAPIGEALDEPVADPHDDPADGTAR